MNPIATDPGVSGFSVEPHHMSDGSTVWRWRAWHDDALEGRSAATYEDACDAVREAHKRLSGF